MSHYSVNAIRVPMGTTLKDVDSARAGRNPLDLFETAARCLDVCWPSDEGPLPSRDQLLDLVAAARAMQNPSGLLASVCDQRDFLAKRVEELEAEAEKDSSCLACFAEVNAKEGKEEQAEREDLHVASCNLCGRSMGEGG